MTHGRLMSFESIKQLEMEMSAFQQRKANATATHTLGKKKK